jgi:hypothetical protein
MKTIAKTFIAIGVVMLVQSANAQKVMNDPSYSIHNYKHPNKANYMKKQLEKYPTQYVEEVKDEEAKSENSLTSSANYKNMSASKSKMKKFRKTEDPDFYVVPKGSAPGNYKMQFPVRKKKVEPTSESFVGKPLASN